MNFEQIHSTLSESDRPAFYKRVYEHELEQIRLEIQQFYEDNIHLVEWVWAINNPNLSDDFYDKHMPKKHYPALVNCKHITSDFVEKHLDDLDWFEPDYQDLYVGLVFWKRQLEGTSGKLATADAAIKDLNHPIRKYWFTRWKLVDSDDEFVQTKSILNFAANARLSPAFIEKYQDRLNWKYLSANPHLPLDFWANHMDRIDMENIWRNFHVTEEFATKHIEQIEPTAFSQNPNISEEFFEQHLDKIDWTVIHLNRGLSKQFFKKYWDRLSEEGHQYLRTLDICNCTDEIEIIVNSKMGCYDFAVNPRIPESLYEQDECRRLKSAECYLRNPAYSPDFFRRQNPESIPNRYMSENTFSYYKQKRLAGTKKYSFDHQWKVHVKIPDVDYTCIKGVS